MMMWRTLRLTLVVLTFSTVGSVSITLAQDTWSIERLVATAKTPADHAAIATLYRTESTKLQRDANQHAALAETLVSEAGGQNPSASHHYEWAEHCRKLAKSLGEAAQEAAALATLHDRLAQSLPTEQK